MRTVIGRGIIAVALVASAITACNGGADQPQSAKCIRKLTLRWIGGLAHPLHLLANGQTQVCLEQGARWTLQMRDPTIATVHATQTTGTITGVTPGTTVLTASAVPLNGTGPSSPYRISVNVSR
jgi:hypothetical protein